MTSLCLVYPIFLRKDRIWCAFKVLKGQYDAYVTAFINSFNTGTLCTTHVFISIICEKSNFHRFKLITMLWCKQAVERHFNHLKPNRQNISFFYFLDNPYPPVIKDPRAVSGLLSNVLLNAARDDFYKNRRYNETREKARVKQQTVPSEEDAEKQSDLKTVKETEVWLRHICEGLYMYVPFSGIFIVEGMCIEVRVHEFIAEGSVVDLYLVYSCMPLNDL